jgi:hypothetical protein
LKRLALIPLLQFAIDPRPLVAWVALRHLRRAHPELFIGAAAAASIKVVLDERAAEA